MIRATSTAPTAIPTFVPVESEEEDKDKDADSFSRDETPVFQLGCMDLTSRTTADGPTMTMFKSGDVVGLVKAVLLFLT